MNVKQGFLCIMAIGSAMPLLLRANGQAQSSSVGNEQSQVMIVANVNVGPGGTFSVAGGAQTGTTGNVSSSATVDQKFTADIPVGPGGGMGGLGGEAQLGTAFLGGVAGGALEGEEKQSDQPYSPMGRQRAGTLTDNPYSGTLSDIDVSAKATATQGFIEKINASSVTFETIEFNKLMQLKLPDYTSSDIKKIVKAGRKLVKGYFIKPAAGKAFDIYKEQGKELSIKLLITIQQARQVTLDSLKEADKAVEPVNGKPILEIIVYRQTPGEAKESEWTEIMAIVQNAYDSRPGALFKIDEKGWLYVYISKVGVPTTLADSGVIEKLPFDVPENLTYTALKDAKWNNRVEVQSIKGYGVAGFQFGKEKILLVNKNNRLVVYRKLIDKWKKVAMRELESPLTKSGYYIQIRNAANNGFLDLYDTNEPAFIFKLAMRNLFGKEVSKI